MRNIEKYGNWALVTGAAKGLGREFCKKIASQKLNLVLVDIDETESNVLANELQNEFGIQCRAINVDLSDETFLEELEPAIVDLNIGLLVNNAGVGCGGSFASRDPKKLAAVVKINCLAPILLTRLLLPGMLQQGRGGIVFVSSLQAFISSPYEATYCASKAFNLHFGESLAGELRKKPVDCITVCPGGMKTEFFLAEGLSQKDSDRMWKYSAEPEDIAELALNRLGRQPVVSPKITLAVNLASRFLPRRFMTWGSERVARKLVKYERT